MVHRRLLQYPSSVAVTWLTTFEQLSESERKLLNILAWLAPEPVPVSLLEGGPVGDLDARDAFDGLTSWSLARWAAEGDEFTVHRLVQEITRQRFPDNEKDNALNAALDLLNAQLPSPDWDEKGWRLWERLAPHCRILLGRLRNHALEPKATRIMNDLASWLHNRAEHGEAEPLYRRALAVDEKSFGPRWRSTSTISPNCSAPPTGWLRPSRSAGGNCESSQSSRTARDMYTHTFTRRSTTTPVCFQRWA
jgi:hypothetical protein